MSKKLVFEPTLAGGSALLFQSEDWSPMTEVQLNMIAKAMIRAMPSLRKVVDIEIATSGSPKRIVFQGAVKLTAAQIETMLGQVNAIVERLLKGDVPELAEEDASNGESLGEDEITHRILAARTLIAKTVFAATEESMRKVGVPLNDDMMIMTLIETFSFMLVSVGVPLPVAMYRISDSMLSSMTAIARNAAAAKASQSAPEDAVKVASASVLTESAFTTAQGRIR